MDGLHCPHCGNGGREDDGWMRNAPTPFRLIEGLLRTWQFETREIDGRTWLIGDTATDEVDWESGDGLRIECCACFEQFPLPDGVAVDFE